MKSDQAKIKIWHQRKKKSYNDLDSNPGLTVVKKKKPSMTQQQQYHLWASFWTKKKQNSSPHTTYYYKKIVYFKILFLKTKIYLQPKTKKLFLFLKKITWTTYILHDYYDLMMIRSIFKIECVYDSKKLTFGFFSLFLCFLSFFLF